MLFKYFAHKISEVDSFKWLLLAEVEVVDVVLSRLARLDRGKYLQCCGCIILRVNHCFAKSDFPILL
nr:MAG TPA: hypothetical protein [Caudoviricetes sp.]